MCLNWEVTNFNSSASKATASTSFIVFTVLVDVGKLAADGGSSGLRIIMKGGLN